MLIRKNNYILCRECGYPIKTRDDLVTAFRWLVVKPMHAACYAKSLRGFRTIFMNNYPLNGAAFMIYVVIFALLGLYAGVSFLSLMPPLGSSFGTHIGALLLWLGMVGIFFIPALIRLYSWLRFEKKLPE